MNLLLLDITAIKTMARSISARRTSTSNSGSFCGVHVPPRRHPSQRNAGGGAAGRRGRALDHRGGIRRAAAPGDRAGRADVGPILRVLRTGAAATAPPTQTMLR